MFNVTFAILLLSIFTSGSLFVIGYNLGEDNVQKQAVASGAATYTLNNDQVPNFVWSK